MSLTLEVFFSLAALTLAYWAVDGLVRQGALDRGLRAAGIRSAHAPTLLGIALTGLLASVTSWDSLPGGASLRWLATGLVGMLAWKAATRDVDPTQGRSHALERVLVVLTAVGVALEPAFIWLGALLLTRPFGVWEHHATLPMRLIQALVAFLGCWLGYRFFGLDDAPLLAGAVFFLLTVQISHYFITALAKAYLGPRWTSWVTDNRVHHLAASAYSWGWARFLGWERWKRVIDTVKVVERPMQFCAFGIELLAPLALLHPAASVAFSLGFATFHLGVFALAGLLFWEWIAADLMLAWAVAALAGGGATLAFGPLAVVVGLVFMAVFPLRHKLFRPMPLGWWDTPLTQRMRWYAEGESGKVYEVYNNFMCPHERIYGKVHGCFLVPHPVCTYHLGEVWKHDLRDAIRDAGPDPAKLDAVRQRFGILPRSESMAETHRRFLRRFFGALNHGANKSILPTWLRWLKAPGGQCYYWGELPAFRGQEKIVRVSIRYREEYFDGERHQRLCDRLIEQVDIPDALEAPAEATAETKEPTPKELDDFLLGYAAGRLIDLPKLGRGYVKGDDGRPA